MSYPRQSSTVHVEAFRGEICLYDWQRGQVHALNPTAALVWQHCDGATSPEAIAAVLSRELTVPEAEAVVRVTLRQLERARLLAVSPDGPAGRQMPTRRALLQRGVAAALLPAIYTIAAPAPLAAQSVAAPTITNLTPSAGSVGSTIDVTITGTGFGTTVAVSGTGITVSNVREISSTTVIVTFAIAANATLGARNVTVTTAGGPSNSLPFTVTAAAPGVPTLTSVAPASGLPGATVAVTLTGTNFVTGNTTVAVSGGVTVQGVTVVNPTSITASFVIDAAAALGMRTVSVTTPSGTSGPVTFTVNPPAPTLTGVAPASGFRGATVPVTLTGTNFVAGTTVAVSGGGVIVQGEAVVNPTSITASFVIDAAAALGPRSVSVTTPGGTSGPVTFTVNPPAPTLTGVAPASGFRGATVPVTLTGTNFVAGTTVAVSAGVTVQGVTVVNPTSITASFVIDAAAGPGQRSVSVTTPGGTSGTVPFSIVSQVTTFDFTGAQQTYNVPAGAAIMTVLALGAQGGAGGTGIVFPPTAGGLGGSVTATIAVTPLEGLAVFVGGMGGTGTGAPGSGDGGFNGGAPGGGSAPGGGGGASDVRRGGTALANRVIVAGGGGGAGDSPLGPVGGGGGGLIGGTGADASVPSAQPAHGGTGGTQSAGGTGGVGSFATGSDGASGVGGAGAASGFGCGGGGGGFFGGGGGGSNGSLGVGGGGGGGSSFAAPSATGVIHAQGVHSGVGQVVITV